MSHNDLPVFHSRRLANGWGLVFVIGGMPGGRFAPGYRVQLQGLWVVSKSVVYDFAIDPDWPATEVVWCRPATAAEVTHYESIVSEASQQQAAMTAFHAMSRMD